MSHSRLPSLPVIRQGFEYKTVRLPLKRKDLRARPKDLPLRGLRPARRSRRHEKYITLRLPLHPPENGPPSNTSPEGGLSQKNLLKDTVPKDGIKLSSFPNKFNAFISHLEAENYEAVLAAASESQSQRLTVVKDNIATRQYRTTCGSKILHEYRSPFDATAVRALLNARPHTASKRRIILGKTNMDEFGMGSHSTNSFFGPVLGQAPLRRHSVGGSSGGSAVAVATGLCSTALGTDTGGSVRLPAAYTGIVGFKPSYGRISRWGVVPYANSLDTVGILADSTKSVEKVLGSYGMKVADPRDPTSLTGKSRRRIYEYRKRLHHVSASRWLYFLQGKQADLPDTYHLFGGSRWLDFPRGKHGPMRIGIPKEYIIAELDSAVREEWRYALNLFQEQGCTLVPVSLPHTKHALSAYYVIAAAEAASNLSKYDGIRYGTRAGSQDGVGDVLYSNTRGSGFGDEVKRRILLGSYSLSSKAIDNYFIKAQKVRRLVQRDFDRVFSLPNLLKNEEQFDLSDIDESVHMKDKLGPPQVDLIVCPTAPTLPPTRNVLKKQSSVNSYMNDVFTVPASLAGLPAISLPFKLPGKDGSAGIQIIGQYADDYKVLLAAAAIESLQLHKASLLKKSRSPPVHKVPVSNRKVRTHPSSKSGILREPRTDKEVSQFVEDAFEEWERISDRR